MPSTTYDEFIQRVREVGTAQSIGAVLEWDQETYMPTKGAEHRATQCALIAGLAHQQLIDDELGQLLERVAAEGDADPVVAANVRETRRVRDRAVKIPTPLVQDIARATTLSRNAWVAARKDSDFAQFAPHLEKLLDLKREVADKIGYDTEPYDALMDEFEPGARATDVQAVFDNVKTQLVPIVEAIRNAPRKPDTSLLERECPQADQARFARDIVTRMGFDFDAGRIDTTTHPFCSGFTPLDVRITTRYDEHYLPMALFGLMHEGGHGLYEQGLDPEHVHTPMGESVSLGIHESQSRMWENLVGRSREFWEYTLPTLQQTFPSLADVSIDDWVFAINNVKPSFIRVEADEVTYNLHIMLRFDIERKMIRNELAVQDIPAAWNDMMQQLLGITPPDDAQGCLQDIHWSMGIFGYFPTYALGNLYACQFFIAARQALSDLEDQIRRGELLPLREWLRSNIHRHGRRYPANELVQVVTGQPLSSEPFIQHLKDKYGPLYGF